MEVDLLVEHVDDLPGVLRELRASGPAVWGRAFGRPSLLLLSHALVQAAFMDEETFPAAATYELVVTDVLGRNIMCMRGDEHRRNRALVSPAFRQRLMPGLVEPLLAPVANELIDEIAGRGEADLVADFTSRYPFLLITRLLGLPHHAEDEVRRWAISMLRIGEDFATALQASQEFVAFVDPILQQKRVDPGDDLLSTLATTEVDGARLTDEEIYNFVKLLFPAGADTTYLGLGNTLVHLLSNPEQLDLVRADLDEQCRWAAEEGLRLDPPTAWIPRTAPNDVHWHGIDIPAGSSLMLGVLAANRDPDVFDRPDEFDVQRRSGVVSTFGFGTHFCLGAHLARTELEVALRLLLERLPNLRLATAEPIRITGTVHQLLRGPTSAPVRFDVA